MKFGRPLLHASARTLLVLALTAVAAAQPAVSAAVPKASVDAPRHGSSAAAQTAPPAGSPAAAAPTQSPAASATPGPTSRPAPPRTPETTARAAAGPAQTAQTTTQQTAACMTLRSAVAPSCRGSIGNVSSPSQVLYSGGIAQMPPGAPAFTMTDTLTEGGTGTGYSAYINAHDDTGVNALSVGIQSDQGQAQSGGAPWYVWERVQNGVFTFQYVAAAPHTATITLKWWNASGEAVFYANGSPIAFIPLSMQYAPPTHRLDFQIEGNARLNGDSVNDTFGPVSISVALVAAWNTSFTFHGLHATDTNGQPQNGATFTVTGTVSGLPPGGNWDNNLVAGIAMIQQG